MSARDHLRLGPDGKYIWVEDPDEAEIIGSTGSHDGDDASKSASDRSLHAGYASDHGKTDDPRSDKSQRNAQSLTSISSSMSGPGIGDDVAAKRASLLHAQGELKVGRRESPPPYDPWPKRKMYLKGASGVVIVLIVVVVLIIFLAGSNAVT